MRHVRAKKELSGYQTWAQIQAKDAPPLWPKMLRKLPAQSHQKLQKMDCDPLRPKKATPETLHGPILLHQFGHCTLQSMGYLQIFAPLPSAVRPIKMMNIPRAILSLLIHPEPSYTLKNN